MKVKIGNYKTYYGPFQIAEVLTCWLPKQKDEFGFVKKHEWSYKLGHFFAFGTFKESDSKSLFSREKRTWFNDLCEWVHSKRKRYVSVKIDKWDHWNAHSTLSIIALPLLKSLRDNSHSYGFINDEDAPEHLSSTYAIDSDGGWDSNNRKRYDWVLDEIIWALEQDQPDYDWEEQYYSGISDLVWKESDKPDEWTIEDGPNNTRKTDWEGLKKHQERIDNGFRLFGKYYQTLWS